MGRRYLKIDDIGLHFCKIFCFRSGEKMRAQPVPEQWDLQRALRRRGLQMRVSARIQRERLRRLINNHNVLVLRKLRVSVSNMITLFLFPFI